MCGISGIFYLDDKKIDKEELQRFNESLEHRGPDGKGYFISKNIGLGHQRLTILDLTNKGSQPMKFLDRYLITYNGEIYNFSELREELKNKSYKFNTDTDTEVILAAYAEWGEEMLNKFNGMWAFAIYDLKLNQLFLSRDRFGIKPLYYMFKNNEFYFASELKAFAFLNNKIRPSIKEEKLVLLEIPTHTEETILKDVKSLEPGNNIFINKNNFIKKKWWHLEHHIYSLSNNYEKIQEDFYNILLSSLKLVLTSDTDVCFSLSGGLDSTAMSSFVRENKIIKYDKTSKNYKNFFNINYENENLFVNQIVENIRSEKDVNVFQKTLKNNDFNFDETVKDIIYMENIAEPATGPFNLYKFMKSKNFKVSIDGHGLDELFGGYGDYIDLVLLSNLFNPINFNKVSSNYSTVYNKSILQNYYRICKLFIKTFILKKSYQPSFLINTKPELFTENFETITFPFQTKSMHDLNTRLKYDVGSGYLPSMLSKFDKISMSYGVESRVPYLDWRLVSFAFSCKNEYKVLEKNKKLPRDAFQKYLKTIPKVLTQSKKKYGFAPRHKWFVDFYGNFVKETINNNDFANVLSFCNVKKLKLYIKENNYPAIKNAYRFCQAYYLKKFFNKPYSYKYKRDKATI
ncbi:MAG: asparagine synthase (glutamine-hydrolyzing) [Pelagibacterales bacterium]|nr:asparagine synthase (glutamine-hydrolyzing) [Pelagibacterales bacterium]